MLRIKWRCRVEHLRAFTVSNDISLIHLEQGTQAGSILSAVPLDPRRMRALSSWLLALPSKRIDVDALHCLGFLDAEVDDDDLNEEELDLKMDDEDLDLKMDDDG